MPTFAEQKEITKNGNVVVEADFLFTVRAKASGFFNHAERKLPWNSINRHASERSKEEPQNKK